MHISRTLPPNHSKQSPIRTTTVLLRKSRSGRGARPEIVVGLEAAGGAKRPARPAMGLILDFRHGAHVSPISLRRRRTAVRESEATIMPANVRGGAVLGLAESATAESKARRLELLPAATTCMRHPEHFYIPRTFQELAWNMPSTSNQPGEPASIPYLTMDFDDM